MCIFNNYRLIIIHNKQTIKSKKPNYWVGFKTFQVPSWHVVITTNITPPILCSDSCYILIKRYTKVICVIYFNHEGFTNYSFYENNKKTVMRSLKIMCKNCWKQICALVHSMYDSNLMFVLQSYGLEQNAYQYHLSLIKKSQP